MLCHTSKGNLGGIEPTSTDFSRPEGFEAESKAEALSYKAKAEAKTIKNQPRAQGRP